MKQILIFMSTIFFASCLENNTIEDITQKINHGDLIFQLTKGSMSNDILEATARQGNLPFSHVGIIYRDSAENFMVIEATHPKVCMTNLEDFINKSQCVAIGRVKTLTEEEILQSVLNAKSKIGLNYDDYFLKDNNEYYCSELVEDCYRNCLNQKVMESYPMTFKNEKGEFPKGWINHFKRINMEIPEGELGTNPTRMAQDSSVEIIGIYKNLN